MPEITQANIGLKQGYAELENGWGPAMNANLRALDLLAQSSVKDKDLTAPPGSPADGDAYIVAASPTGAWSGHATHIARYKIVDGTSAAGWEFYTPREGWETWIADEDLRYRFNGSNWALIPVPVDPSIVGINAQSGTTYAFVLADAGKVVRQTNAAAITDTIPANATVAFPTGSVISIRQVGAGAVTVTPAGGVTLNIPTGYVAKTGRLHATIMLHKVGTNEWDITGDLATS